MVQRLTRGSYLVSLWPLSSQFTDFGGAERTRTADFLLAKQVLYQLSYRPGDADNAVENSGSHPRHILATV
jgi:hypothetical protein